MKTRLDIPKELITHIDVMNTLGGGTTEPLLRRTQYEQYREVALNVPGIPAERIKVEINNNKLTAYYLTTIHSQGMEISVPRMLIDKAMPYFVDIPAISVRSEGEKKIIRFPFNGLSKFHKDFSGEN